LVYILGKKNANSIREKYLAKKKKGGERGAEVDWKTGSRGESKSSGNLKLSAAKLLLRVRKDSLCAKKECQGSIWRV